MRRLLSIALWLASAVPPAVAQAPARDALTIATGEDVLVFLSVPSPSGVRMPVGLAPGKLRIVRDERGVRSLVRHQDQLTLLDAHTGAVSQADAIARMDYAAFVAEIEAAVAAKRAAKSGEAK